MVQRCVSSAARVCRAACRWRAALAAAMALLVGHVHAMEFSTMPLDSDPRQILIFASGEIRPGDDARLHALVGSLPANATVLGIALNSPGGNYVEGVRLATSVRNSHIKSAVVPKGVCASACFLIFAGGDTRMVFADARVGVHSASDDGEDTIIAEGVTTLMAREANELGVPAAIIGKMVTTPPDKIAWLTPADLRSMNVEIVAPDAPRTADYVPGSALRPGTTAQPSPPSAPPAYAYASPGSGRPPVDAPVASIAPSMPAPSASFLQGRADRTTYQAWFDSQVGDLRLGAAWWAEHRSQAVRQHLTCASASGQSLLFAQGCIQAQALLTKADARRLSDPEYRSGWNSL